MARLMETNETVIKNIRHANAVLEGCILSLPISEQSKGALKDCLRILYEFSIYPIVAPGADSKATSSLPHSPEDASNVSVGDSSSDPKENGW